MRWFDEVKAGASIKAIALREGVTRQRVGQVLRLTLLDPGIVENAIDGRQPERLTVDRIVKSPHRELWSDQRAWAESLRAASRQIQTPSEPLFWLKAIRAVFRPISSPMTGLPHRGLPLTPGNMGLFGGRSETGRQQWTGWLGRQDSNLRMAAPKAAALPLGDAPKPIRVLSKAATRRKPHRMKFVTCTLKHVRLYAVTVRSGA